MDSSVQPYDSNLIQLDTDTQLRTGGKSAKTPSHYWNDIIRASKDKKSEDTLVETSEDSPEDD